MSTVSRPAKSRNHWVDLCVLAFLAALAAPLACGGHTVEVPAPVSDGAGQSDGSGQVRDGFSDGRIAYDGGGHFDGSIARDGGSHFDGAPIYGDGAGKFGDGAGKFGDGAGNFGDGAGNFGDGAADGSP